MRKKERKDPSLRGTTVHVIFGDRFMLFVYFSSTFL